MLQLHVSPNWPTADLTSRLVIKSALQAQQPMETVACGMSYLNQRYNMPNATVSMGCY